VAEIRRELRALGLERRRPGRLLFELGVHVSLLATGVAGFLLATGPGVRLAWLLLAMLGHVGVTSNSHSWAHRSGSRSRRFDDAWALFTGAFVSGISVVFWHDKHNRRHHGSPNVKGVDPDHDFSPFVALAESDLLSRPAWLKRYYRWQLCLFPVLLALMIPRMKAEGTLFAARRAFSRQGGSRALARLDVAALLAGHAVWWGVPLWFGGPLEALLLNAFRETFLSYALFAIFAPAHVPRQALFLEQRGLGDAVLRQVATTLDYRAGRLAGFFLSGLDYQIEHHLLPDLPHPCYRPAAAVVERILGDHGYPYRRIGWGRGLLQVLDVLHRPKRVTRRLEGRMLAPVQDPS
jgi:fatty acid desaturase